MDLTVDLCLGPWGVLAGWAFFLMGEVPLYGGSRTDLAIYSISC